MHIDPLMALLLYAFVASITPGPNNLMLMASGANFGFKRTVPHMMGVVFGFTFMFIVVGVGVIGLFNLWPTSYQILKIVSIIYLLWLSWRIANSKAPESNAERSKPLSFISAALFQWVNPKAWAMATSAITIYAPKQDLVSILQLAIVFGFVNFPAVSIWAVMGQGMQHWLTTPSRLKLFNWGMAALLVASLVMIL